MAAQIQAVTLIMGGYWFGKKLDISHPWQKSWLFVIFPICLVIIAHTFYTVIRFMMRRGFK